MTRVAGALAVAAATGAAAMMAISSPPASADTPSKHAGAGLHSSVIKVSQGNQSELALRVAGANPHKLRSAVSTKGPKDASSRTARAGHDPGSGVSSPDSTREAHLIKAAASGKDVAAKAPDVAAASRPTATASGAAISASANASSGSVLTRDHRNPDAFIKSSISRLATAGFSSPRPASAAPANDSHRDLVHSADGYRIPAIAPLPPVALLTSAVMSLGSTAAGVMGVLLVLGSSLTVVATARGKTGRHAR